MWLEQFAHGHWEKMTRALFLVAARNSTNDGPAFVNSLVPENEKEKEILLGGESKNVNSLLQRSSEMSLFPSQKDRQFHICFILLFIAFHKSNPSSVLQGYMDSYPGSCGRE